MANTLKRERKGTLVTGKRKSFHVGPGDHRHPECVKVKQICSAPLGVVQPALSATSTSLFDRAWALKDASQPKFFGEPAANAGVRGKMGMQDPCCGKKEFSGELPLPPDINDLW